MAGNRLTVFRGSPPSNQYVWSPFVTKLEARLRFASVPYTLGAGSPRTAPRGKIPYIDVNGQTIGDSTFIIKHLLEEDVIPRDTNTELSPVQRATDLAIRALMEDKVYFYGTREKWCDNYDAMVSGVLAAVPWFLRWLVGILAFRKTSRTLDGQGTGLLSQQEIAILKEEVWEALSSFLEESKRISNDKNGGEREPYWVLGGEESTEADATVYGFVVGALLCDA